MIQCLTDSSTPTPNERCEALTQDEKPMTSKMIESDSTDQGGSANSSDSEASTSVKGLWSRHDLMSLPVDAVIDNRPKLHIDALAGVEQDFENLTLSANAVKFSAPPGLDSPQKSIERASEVAKTHQAEILSYGPNGSPKRRARRDPRELLAVFSYGPNGSPKKGHSAQRAADTAHRRVKFEDRAGVKPNAVLGYGPSGTPKQNAHAAILGYGPNGSPKKEKTQQRRDKSSSEDVVSKAQREKLPLKINGVSDCLRAASKTTTQQMSASAAEFYPRASPVPPTKASDRGRMRNVGKPSASMPTIHKPEAAKYHPACVPTSYKVGTFSTATYATTSKQPGSILSTRPS